MKSRNAFIRCPIHGSIPLSRRELALIDSPYFQRLRRISQLGFTSFVFPGAVHTRFSHSVGAMHLAGKVFDQLMRNQYHSLTDYYRPDQLEYYRQIIRFAALLHDIGHPPFSHAAESLLPTIHSLEFPKFLKPKVNRQSTHEDFSHMIIYHLARENQLLNEDEALDIISILSKKQRPSARLNSTNGKPMIFPLLCQIINGEIDADRMDYLLRDSYFAGVPYGKFDLDRLVGSFSCCLDEESEQFLLAIEGEGVPSYEIFLLARVHMFYQIYFHKSLGAYRYYLKMAFDEGELKQEIDGSLENVLVTTETVLMEEIRQNRNQKWAGKIHHRVPAKNLIRVLDGKKGKLAKLNEVEQILKGKGIELIPVYSSNQYSSQVKNKKINSETILVIDEEFGKDIIIPLAEKSHLLEKKQKRIELSQLYVHREDYEAAIEILQNELD